MAILFICVTNVSLEFIKNIEQEELHPAPDYLKKMILRKAKPVSKRTQLIIYSIKTIAVTAAALMILFTLPQNQPVNKYPQQQERILLQNQIQNEKKIWQEKFLKEREKTSITDFLNQKTNYLCNQLLTIFEKENN